MGATTNGSLPKSITSLGPKEGIEGLGIGQQSLEAAGAVEEAAGIGAASSVGAAIAGKPAPSQTAAKQVGAAESAAQQGIEKGSSALTGWVGEVTKWIEEHALRGALDFVLVLVGGILIVAGVLIALKPRGQALPIGPL
jgi:hypothetical protein